MTDVPETSEIIIKIHQMLDHCLHLFNIHKNVEHIIKNKMISIIKKNKEIGRLKNIDAIVFTLLIYSIKELKIPLNKKTVNEKIKNYIATNNMLKDLKNLSL